MSSFTLETTHVSIHSVSETEEKTVLCGLGGAWPEGEQGYIMNRNHPDHISDLDRIFGYDTHKTMYSGGWRSPNVFVFYMRSASLLCDYRYECTFLEDELVVKLSFNTRKRRMFIFMADEKEGTRNEADYVWRGRLRTLPE